MSLLPRFLFLAVGVVCVSCKTLPLPSYISACNRNDLNFDECATRNGQAALPMLVKGDRKYRIPSLDPLEIEELIIGRGNGSVSIDLKVNDAKIFGFRNTQIKSSKFELDEKVITFKLLAASLQLTGEYSIDGKVLFLPITGKGFINITLENSDFALVLKYKLDKKADGLDYVSPYDCSLRGSPTLAHIRLDNLFNGNKALSDGMNQVLNDNWEGVIDELGNPLLDGIGLVLLQVVTNALRNVPYDAVFPVKF